MKSNKNEKKAMSAIQFMNMFDDTMAQMEAIGNLTQNEEIARLESIDGDYVDDDGLFDMGSMLDVNIKGEDDQPQLYNTPRNELTDGDKALIVEELAKQLSDLPDVIDFSDIGPIATVIQTKLGYNQPLDGFINDLISGAVDKQNSQSFAKGTPVPGEVDAGNVSPEGDINVDKGPTEIAPTKAPIDSNGPESMEIDPMMDSDPMMDISLDDAIITPIDAPAIDGDGLGELDNISSDLDGMDVGDDIDGELGGEPDDLDDLEGISDELSDVSAELDDVEAVVDDKTNDLVGEDINDEVDDVENEIDDVETEIVSETLEGNDDDDDDDDDDDLDIQLESIKQNYFNSTVDALVEAAQKAIKKQSTLVESEEEEECHTKQPEPMLEEVPEALPVDGDGYEDDDDDDDDDVMTALNAPDPVDGVLESIITKFHATEDSKELKALAEAAKTESDTKLDTILESIISDYHTERKAKLEATEKEVQLESELNALVESYHKNTTNAKLENADARKKVRSRLDALTK